MNENDEMDENIFEHLPEKVKLKFLINEDKEKGENLSEEEKNVIKINKDYLESKLWLWKKDENFEFLLPPTTFKEKKVIEREDNLRYHDQRIQYGEGNMVGQPFSQEILDQIWKNGEFNIPSTDPELPYTWKLSKLTVKGLKNIYFRYRKDMSISFLLFYSLYYRFSNYNYQKLFPCSFPSSFYNLYISFYKLIHLFFGLPMYDHNEYKIIFELKRERLLDFINSNKEKDFDFTFFSSKNKRKLIKFDEDFDRIWMNTIKPKLLKNYKEQNLNKGQITTNLAEDKKKEFLDYLNKKQAEIQEIPPCTKDYLLSQQILNNYEFYYNLEKQHKIENYENKLKENYIRDLCKLWHEDKINAYFEKVTKEIEDQKEEKIKKEIQNKKDPSLVYSYNTKNNKELPNLIKEKAKKEKEPYNTYKIERYLTKPYEKYQEETDNGTVRYYLRKSKYYEVKTSFFFWRVILFIIKLFCYFCNFNILVFRQMTDSMFGIKALCTFTLFRDYSIDNYNGKIEEIKQTYTFPRSIYNLWKWIMESRRDFESKPDTGILGKGCTRIFNLFWNYLFRMLFLGTLLITLYPLCIFLNIAICLYLIIFSPVIIIFFTILDYLFCLIIYNRYDMLKLFPLIRIVLFYFLIGFAIQLISTILSIVIQPILGIFFFVYSQIHFILRFLYDLFFYSIFKCLGKVPESNNCIAWVQSGPGLFRDRYYDIKIKDVIFLVIGELEKRIMRNYKYKMQSILNEPKDTIKDIKKIYSKIGLTYDYNYLINNTIDFYMKKLNDQISVKRFYPECNVPVKFTEEKIDKIKNLTELYITEFSQKNDISFELKRYEEKKFQHLAEDILKTIFGENVFEPLQSTDKIVHLQSAFKNELDAITTKIFENPMFDDKIYIEERPKENKIVRLPDFANFEQIFRDNLYLDLSYLNTGEKANLLINEDEIMFKI